MCVGSAKITKTFGTRLGTSHERLGTVFLIMKKYEEVQTFENVVSMLECY